MSIVVPCSCGQKLAASPQMAGRLISCPKCGRMLTVGASAGAAPAASSGDNSQLLLYVGIGVGGVIAIGVIALVAYMVLTPGSKGAPVATAPAANTGAPQGGAPAPTASGTPATTSTASTSNNSNSAAPSSPPQPTAPIRNLANVEPDLRLNAKDLALEWEAGPAAADAKYSGKIIEVEGSVKEYGAIFKDRKEAGGYVQIGNMEVLFKDVRCEFAATEWQEKIARKSKVKIKGLWLPTPLPDTRIGVTQTITRDKCSLENCVFSEIGANPRLVVTAEAMSELARTNEEEFRAVYGDYFADLLVTGEVESVERNSQGNVCIALKTSAPPRVLIAVFGNVAALEAKMKADLPVGTKISLKGKYNSAIPTDNKPIIYLNGTIKKE